MSESELKSMYPDLYKFIESSKEEEVRAWVNSASEDDKGRAMYYSGLDGNIPAIQALIRYTVPVDIKDTWGRTALHGASMKNRVQCIKFLLEEESASVDTVHAFGDSALHKACWWGSIDSAKLLIENHSNINLVNKRGESALHKACSKGHLDCAKLLAEKDSALISREADSGETGLMMAIRGGHTSLINYLIPKCEAEDFIKSFYLSFKNNQCQRFFEHLRPQFNDKHLLLHRSVRKGNELNVAVFKFFASDEEKKDEQGRTAKELAEEMGNRSLLALLNEQVKEAQFASALQLALEHKDKLGDLANFLCDSFVQQNLDFSKMPTDKLR